MEFLGAMVVVISILSLNTIATIGILKDDDLYDAQKKLQIILVWVVPLLGASITYFIRRIDSLSPTHKTGGDNLLNDDAFDVWVSEQSDHSNVDNGHD